MTLDPVVVLAYLELATPAEGDDTTTVERVRQALCDQHRYGRGARWSIAAPVLRPLSAAVDKAEGRITIAIRPDSEYRADEIVAVWPGFVDTPLGVAIDLGSTTIAVHLCDLSTGDVIASDGRMPADPFRRGLDEPGVIRDDASGRRSRTHPGGAGCNHRRR